MKFSTRVNGIEATSGQAETENKNSSSLLLTIFLLGVAFIALVSAYDAFLVYKYRVGVDERNGICRWLIEQDPESVVYFILGKGLGTLGVVTVLCGLYRFWRKGAMTVVASLVIFQVGLMGYIHTAEPAKRKMLLAGYLPSATIENDGLLARQQIARRAEIAKSRANRKKSPDMELAMLGVSEESNSVSRSKAKSRNKPNPRPRIGGPRALGLAQQEIHPSVKLYRQNRRKRIGRLARL